MPGLFSSSEPAYFSLIRTGVGIQNFRFPVVLQISGRSFVYGGPVFSQMPGREISALQQRLKRAGL